jgi:hypothetical protein
VLPDGRCANRRNWNEIKPFPGIVAGPLPSNRMWNSGPGCMGGPSTISAIEGGRPELEVLDTEALITRPVAGTGLQSETLNCLDRRLQLGHRWHFQPATRAKGWQIADVDGRATLTPFVFGKLR